MIRLAVSCIWICLVTAASAFVGTSWKVNHAAAGESPEAHGGPHDDGKAQTKKTRPVNVPVIADGAVQGYIVAQFVYTVDPVVAKQLTVPPEAFLLDEAFKRFYSDDKLDFKHLERYDIDRLTKDLVRAVNARLGANVLKDVLIDEFNYVSKDEIPK